MSVDLSIIIVNWNTRDLLAECLHSIADCRLRIADCWPPDCPIYQSTDLPVTEVFVIDNASTDGSAAMVRERFPWVKLIENTDNVGFARANNQALRVASGRYLLLLNSDTEVTPGALEHLIEALEKNPRAGAVGPQMVDPDGAVQNSFGRLPTILDEIIGPYLRDRVEQRLGSVYRHFAGHEKGIRDWIVTERVSFACTMIRRQALTDVGLLDEGFAFYSEDYDWFKRLKAAGWQVLFCPSARVIHHWGASSGQRNEWARWQLYRSKRLYTRKHYGVMAELLLRVGLGLRFMAKALVVCLSWQRRAAPGNCRDHLQLVCQMLRPLDGSKEEAP